MCKDADLNLVIASIRFSSSRGAEGSSATIFWYRSGLDKVILKKYALYEGVKTQALFWKPSDIKSSVIGTTAYTLKMWFLYSVMPSATDQITGHVKG
jgi:hypothetical protein